MTRYSRITGTGSYLPPRRVTNAELVADLASRGIESSNEWIVERTGIQARHFADAAVACSDLALEAARHALQAASLRDDRAAWHQPRLVREHLQALFPIGVVRGLEGYERVAGRYGVQLRDPLADRRLISFCLALPLHWRDREGWTKYIARRWASAALPDVCVWRSDKIHLGHLLGFPIRANDAGMRSDRSDVAGLRHATTAVHAFQAICNLGYQLGVCSFVFTKIFEYVIKFFIDGFLANCQLGTTEFLVDQC